MAMSEQDIRRHLAVVAAATASERVLVNGALLSPLLTKSEDDLYEFWRQGLSAIALKNGEIVAHAAIEPLAEGNWFELGAVWTREDVRGKVDGLHQHVGLRLYQAILARHREKNILATTVNRAAMIVGWRVGMVALTYSQLPRHVWEATCCCPTSKTGVERALNVPHCKMRETLCFVRVTKETWERLGSPFPRNLPIDFSAHQAEVVIPHDDLVIVLSG
jgi:N-acetylglutamate synthase-like GNAT family acetyltransferase